MFPFKCSFFFSANTFGGMTLALVPPPPSSLYWKTENTALRPQQQRLSSPEMLSERRSVATKLKCDIKLVGSATSRRKNSNYFLSLLFLRLLLLPSLPCAFSVSFLSFFFFFSWLFHYDSEWTDFWCISLLLSRLAQVHATFSASCPHDKEAGRRSKVLTLCWASTSNSFLQKGCSEFFFFPTPTLYYLSSSARLHIHLYLQAHLFTGRETDSEEKAGWEKRPSLTNSGNRVIFLFVSIWPSSFLFIIHLGNIFRRCVSSGTRRTCVCAALKQTVCMVETISIMCSRITEARKVSPPPPFTFITRCLMEKFPFCSFMCLARQLSFKVSGVLRQAFFFFFYFFFLYCSWKSWWTVFKVWMGRCGWWGEQQPVYFFLFPQTKK